MNTQVDLGADELLFLTDGQNTVGIVKAAATKRVFIETDEEELVQFLEPDDLIAVSCFSGGEKARAMVRCMLFLVREGGTPLLVLKKGHPATRRLPLVISAGQTIKLSGCIVPGTHPEQDVLCGRGAMDGMTIRGEPASVRMDGGGHLQMEKVAFNP